MEKTRMIHKEQISENLEALDLTAEERCQKICQEQRDFRRTMMDLCPLEEKKDLIHFRKNLKIRKNN